MEAKKCFTLLEMMVALLILGLIGSVVTVQVKKLIDSHRFDEEVTDLFIALQEAQVFAATWQTDLALDLSVKKGSVTYRFSTWEPLSAYQFKQDSVRMSHVSFLRFQKDKIPSLHIDIYSGGRIEPRGALGFFQSAEDGRTLWFDLQHGTLLKYSSQKPPILKNQIPAPRKEQ